MPTVTQVHGIPLWLLRDYLQDLGGEALTEEVLDGEGWQARLQVLPPAQIGSLRVGRVQVEIEAEQDVLDRFLPAFERKTLRAGA